MPLWAVPLLAFVACAISGWIAYRSDDRCGRLMALSNLLVWTVANAGWLYSSMWLLPIVDWYVGIGAISLWWMAPRPWLRVYINLVAARLILHLLDTLTGHAFFVPYLHAVNATYAGMLVCAGLSGGKNDFTRWRDRLHLLRRLRGLRGTVSSAEARGLGRGR
jgi:hypothetical protein